MADDLYGSPEHQLFRRTVRKFVQEELVPRAREFDEMGHFDKSLYKKMGALGMLGLKYDPEWGGAGLDWSYTAVMFDEIGSCDNAGVAMGIPVHTDMATPSLDQSVSADLKRRFSVLSSKVAMVSAVPVTDADVRSDILAATARAVRQHDAGVITGSEISITDVPAAHILCLLAV